MYVCEEEPTRPATVGKWWGTVALSGNAANPVRLLDDRNGRAQESIQEGLMNDWILPGMFSWGMDEEERMG